MEKDVAGDGIETRSPIGRSGSCYHGRFRRQIMPHEFGIESDCGAGIYAATNHEVSSGIGEVTDTALGKTYAAADVERVMRGFLLGPCNDTQTHHCYEQLHDKIFLHDHSHLPLVVIRNTQERRSYECVLTRQCRLNQI